MIGEPEIDGDWDTTVRAQEALPDRPRERERVRIPRAPWLWALGGAVVASAVWAGTLAVQDRFSATPRIDYRHSGDLCKEAELKTVAQAVGRPVEGVGGSSQGVAPAQDWAYCRLAIPWDKGDTLAYGAQALVELHKEIDPQTEFATGPGATSATRLDLEERREVAGLGDRALLDHYYAGEGERLMVLDGGAVFTLTVEWYGTDGDRPSGVDEDAIGAAMIEDMRILMAKLRR
ncbi:hypothetical protein OG389_24310 [Streptomyces sp. NBC_00435]|uniref:hypothetical protein n=1 Tax=Streptomyces sp. NBC_00435 TaxID=2903649 RepID=UPI002E1D99EA